MVGGRRLAASGTPGVAIRPAAQTIAHARDALTRRCGGWPKATTMAATTPNPDTGEDPRPGPDPDAGPGEDPGAPAFGPAGYVPPRAAARARKIVLREQMGLQWTIAAVVAGVLILAITVPLVLSSSGPPGPPSVDAGPLSQVDARGDGVVDVDGAPVLVVRGGGVLAAFLDAPQDARYCAASRRIEAPDGRVWSLQGRLLGGSGASLARVPATAYDGRLFVDPTAPEVLAPSSGEVAPACA